MQKIIDISPEIHPEVAVWPGDLAFSRSVALDMKSGDNLTLSSINTTVHLGAHADAPNHYQRDEVGISGVSLEAYIGHCQVVHVQLPRGERIKPEHLSGRKIEAPRVLFATQSFPDPDNFNEDFNSLSPELIKWLAEQGVCLVGLDTPSVDPFSSKALESHQELHRTGMRNLEGLVLSHVEEGFYFLSALPLKLKDVDASPVRAVLVQDVN
ncbi:MAG: cyclase family protein [Bdellovibrionales bacterium]|nr:cyclase family protein [Bdellovibrionales bacterium]